METERIGGQAIHEYLEIVVMSVLVKQMSYDRTIFSARRLVKCGRADYSIGRYGRAAHGKRGGERVKPLAVKASRSVKHSPKVDKLARFKIASANRARGGLGHVDLLKRKRRYRKEKCGFTSTCETGGQLLRRSHGW
jgi:hypothetical protein